MSKKQAIQELLNRKSTTSVINPDNAGRIDNTGIQETANTFIHAIDDDVIGKKQKTKATFELDTELHKQLKIFAATQGKKMIEIVEDALKAYLKS